MVLAETIIVNNDEQWGRGYGLVYNDFTSAFIKINLRQAIVFKLRKCRDYKRDRKIGVCMSSYRKLGKDVLLMTIGSFGSKLLTFVFVPFYTAMLTTEEYGIADLVSTTTTLLFPFFSLIICEAMMRFALDKENNPKEVYSIGIKVTLTGTLVFLLLSPIIFLTPLKEHYGFVIAYYIAHSFHHAISYFVRGINKTKVFALGGIVQTFVVVTTGILFLVPFQLGILGYLLSHVLGSIASILYMFIAAKIYKYGFTLQITDKQLQKKMLAYSLPMIPNSASWWLANSVGKFFLIAFVGTSASGIFSVANKIPHIMTTMTGIFGRAWKINSVHEFGSEQSKKFFSDAFSKLMCMIVLIVSFMLVVNKPLAYVLFSKSFYQAWRFVPVLLFSTAMHAYAEFYGSIYTASYKTKFLVISTGLGASLNIVLDYLLVPLMGIMGAAIAVASAQMVIFISRLIHSRKIMQLKINWKKYILCYIVLIAQIYIAVNTFRYEYFYSAICCVLIIVLLYKDMKQMIMMFKHGVKKKR